MEVEFPNEGRPALLLPEMWCRAAPGSRGHVEENVPADLKGEPEAATRCDPVHAVAQQLHQTLLHTKLEGEVVRIDSVQ